MNIWSAMHSRLHCWSLFWSSEVVQHCKVVCDVLFHHRPFDKTHSTSICFYLCFFTELNKRKDNSQVFFIRYCNIICYVQYCAEEMLSKYTCNNAEINLDLRTACVLVQLQKTEGNILTITIGQKLSETQKNKSHHFECPHYGSYQKTTKPLIIISASHFSVMIWSCFVCLPSAMF